MTLDEASQILNVKKGAVLEESELQKMLKVRSPLVAPLSPFFSLTIPFLSFSITSVCLACPFASYPRPRLAGLAHIRIAEL